MITLPASKVIQQSTVENNKTVETDTTSGVLLSSITVTSSIGPDNNTVRIAATRGEVLNGAWVVHSTENYVINPDGSALSDDGANGNGNNSFVAPFIAAVEQFLISSTVEPGTRS